MHARPRAARPAASTHAPSLWRGPQVYGIDGFDTSAATVAAMKQAGLYPICYFR